LILLETIAWEDMENSIHDVELALRLALEATEDDFRRWEEETGDRLEDGRFDEFSLPAKVVADLSPARIGWRTWHALSGRSPSATASALTALKQATRRSRNHQERFCEASTASP
jgi:hypothetical protein